jgi:GrpB-like predicted nucleotidyltransferase (UPF0157 family)
VNARSIAVVDYDPRWPQLFEEIRSRVAPYVAGASLAIEHVGSTSVPGLCAKPVIDLDIVVRTGDVAQAIARLVQAGYRHRGDLGVPGREAFDHDFEPAHNLYVCVAGSPSLRNHLILRGALRSDPRLAQTYGSLKQTLAERYPKDIDAYIAGKSELIQEVLGSSGQFSRDELDAIRRANNPK